MPILVQLSIQRFSSSFGFRFVGSNPTGRRVNPTAKRAFTNYCRGTVIHNFGNQDDRIGPLTRPLTRSLAPLTHSLAAHCSLRSRAPLRSFVCSLAHSLTPELMGKWFLSKNLMRQFHTVSAHCALPLLDSRSSLLGFFFSF